MATLQQLEQALIAADRAGNAEDARALAGEITRMRAAPAPVAAPTLPPVQPPDASRTAKRPDGSVTTIQPDGSEDWLPPTGPAPVTPLANRPATDLSMDELGQVLNAQSPAFSSIAPGRAAKIAGQGVASGLTSAAMLPLDLPVLASKGLNYGVEALAGAGGRQLNNLFQTGAFTYNPPTGDGLPIPSEAVKSGASWAAQKLGYEPAVPETMQEKALYNVADLGSAGLGGAGILGRLAALRKVAMAEPGALPRFGDKFLQPYMEQPVKSAIADTAGGATAGGALTGSQALPENIRDTAGGSVGTMADLVAMLSGGVSGGTLASSAMRTPTAIGNLVRSNMRANIPFDPVTGLATSNKTADDVTRILRGSVTQEPSSVAATMRQEVKDFTDAGMPIPSTGQLARGQLAGVERRERTLPPTLFEPNTPPAVRQQESFLERDKAQRQYAADQVQSVLPPAPDPAEVARAAALRNKFGRPEPEPTDQLFQSRASERAQMELEARQRQVDQPTGQAESVRQGRVEASQPVRVQEGATPRAAEDIFDVYTGTRKVERERSDAMFNRPEFTEHEFNIGSMQRTAAEIRARAERPGSAAVTPETEAVLQRIESASEAGTLTGSVLKEMQADIEREIKGATTNSKRFKELKELKDSIDRTYAGLPRGHPAREAIELARENWAERIKANYRDNVGGSLDARLKANPGQVIPETAGAEFLNTGSGTRQLQEIGAQRGNAEAVAANSRAIVFDELTKTGVIENGVLNPEKLTAWRNQNNHIISEIPGLQTEVNGMIASARRGSNTAGQYAEEIAAAEARLKETQQGIRQGPVGKIADKTPQEAVASILEGQNAAKNIADLRAKTGNNPEALKSLKDNVARYFVDRASKLDTSLEGNIGTKPIQTLINDFNKHRATLVAAGFTPEEMQAVQRAQTVLLPLLNRNVQATVGSITAENTAAAMRPVELMLKWHYGTLKGGSVFRNVKQALALAKGDNAPEIQRLLRRTMVDPELAATLLTRDVAKAGTPAWTGQLQKLIRRTEVAKDVATDDE